MSKINQSLIANQQQRIASVGFGVLLKIKCNSVPEKLSLWLINNFNINKSELAIQYRGTINVDDHAVK